LYYENYILINIEIPNFEEIKKKYFDNDGNKIVLINDNYSIQSPFEYFTPVMGMDPTGHFPGLLTALFIGAIVGITSQFATDVISNIIKNGFNISQWEFSSWESYVGALIGGAIGGLASLVAGPAVSAALDGLFSSTISMMLENLSGKSEYTFGEILFTSAFIASFSGLTAGLLEGITKTPNDMVDNLLKHTQKGAKTKMDLLKQGIFNSIPYSSINTFLNGVTLKPCTD